MRNAKMVTLISLLLLTISGVALAHWTGNDADQPVSDIVSNNWGAYKTRIAADTTTTSPYFGNLYCVWVQYAGTAAPKEIYFSRSTDHGVTWSGTSGNQIISANDGQSVVYNYGIKVIDIAVNSAGEIFVVWSEDLVDIQEIMMVKSSDGGNTWLHSDTDFPISFNGSPANDAFRPQIAVDKDDNLYVVWHQKTSADTSEIHISVSTDDGATWTGQTADHVISFPDANSAVLPDVGVASSGDVYVVWAERRDIADFTSVQILYGKSVDGGVTFNSMTADYPASAPIRGTTDPMIAIENSDNIHVAWRGTRASETPFLYEIFYTRSTDDGVNWNATADTIAIDSGVEDGISSNNHGFAVTSTGKLIAVWNETPEGGSISDIWASYSTDGGNTWTGPFDPDLVDSAGGTNAYTPDVVVDAGDTLHAVFCQYPPSASYYDAYYSRSDTLAGEVGPTPGRLDGHITDIDTSNPLSDVIVEVDTNGVLVAADTTGVLGAYSITLDALTYYSANFHIYTHRDSTISPITILEGQVTILDVALTEATQGTISGQVFEETGTTPLTNAAIIAQDGPSTGDDSTDVSGNYEITLYPGTYTVEFSADLFEDTTVTDVVLGEGGAVVLNMNMRWAIPADDVGPVSLDEPQDIMVVGRSYTPKITVENYGYQDQTFDLNLIIEDGSFIELYNETFIGASVDSLGTVQVVFGVDFTPLLTDTYQLTATAINVDDENAGNNVMVFPRTAYEHQSVGGPDDYGYFYRDNLDPCGPVFNWIDISTTGTQLNPTDHYFHSDNLPIGFSFEFYGQTYTTMWVNSHGTLNMGNYVTGNWIMTNDCPVPDTSGPHGPMLLPWWDGKEIHYEIGQGVYYQYFDEPTVDYTVVQWNAATYSSYYNWHDTTQFEVIIYENGRIVFQYNKVTPSLPGGQGDSATVGLEYDVPPALDGISYLCNDDNPGNRLFAGLAIEWITDIGEPGSISGVVTDADTDLPIEGVYVEANVPGAHDLTNSLGEYSLPGLYACDYNVSFSHAAYIDTTVTGVVVSPDAATTLNVEMQAPQYGLAYLPGDVNMANGAWQPQVIGSDVTYLVNYFRGLPTSSPCLLESFWCSADANGDCNVIGSDVTKLVNYFRGQTTIDYCPEHEPLWLSPDDLPEEAPDGWPNCE